MTQACNGYEEAIEDNDIKTIQQMKLSKEAKKDLKEGIVFDTFHDNESNVAIASVNTIDVQKVKEHERFSNYILPPLKRSFIPLVRIVALALRAVKKFKEYGMRRKVRKGEADVSELNRLLNEGKEEVKFSMFSVCAGEFFNTNTDEEDPVSLFDMISANGIPIKLDPEAEVNVLIERKKITC